MPRSVQQNLPRGAATRNPRAVAEDVERGLARRRTNPKQL